jgi:hypothetical protein
MCRRRSIFNDPEFRYIAFVIAMLLLGSIVYNIGQKGFIAAIISGLQGMYNLIYASIFVASLFAIVVWHKKMEIIGQLAWDHITRKKR